MTICRWRTRVFSSVHQLSPTTQYPYRPLHLSVQATCPSFHTACRKRGLIWPVFTSSGLRTLADKNVSGHISLWAECLFTDSRKSLCRLKCGNILVYHTCPSLILLRAKCEVQVWELKARRKGMCCPKPVQYWDLGFESHQSHGYVYALIFFRVSSSLAMYRRPVQRYLLTAWIRAFKFHYELERVGRVIYKSEGKQTKKILSRTSYAMYMKFRRVFDLKSLYLSLQNE
jgi:hypothetical protein